MTKRKMKATVTVYPTFHRISYDVTVPFTAYSGDTSERMRENAAQVFRFIGMDVKPHETIIIEEEAK